MESTAPPTNTTLTLDLATVGAWVLVLLTVAAIGYVVYRFIAGWRSLSREEDDHREREFEENLLREFVAPENGAPPLPPPSAAAPQLKAEPAPPLRGEGQEGGAIDVEELARRLFALRVISDRQGTVPLPVPPAGLIYSLAGGGSCVLLPRQESDAVMEHMARRFDMVFYPSATGELLVLERFQRRLPKLTGDPS